MMWTGRILGLLACGLLLGSSCQEQQPGDDSNGGTVHRVVIESRGWQLVGDFFIPDSATPVPAVLLLNKAAGDRAVYEELASQLAQRGVASLRLDLPGHGESINLGRFMPGEKQRDPIIWDAEVDVVAAYRFLQGDVRVDGRRVGMVGASYSGEEMAEAGRLHGYAQAYVELSPGSFSDQSIASIDSSGVAWLFIASKEERYLQEITQLVQERSQGVEVIIVPGVSHATDILLEKPELAERISVWLTHHLR